MAGGQEASRLQVREWFRPPNARAPVVVTKDELHCGNATEKVAIAIKNAKHV